MRHYPENNVVSRLPRAKRQRGFTLVELLVTMILMAIVAGLAVPLVGDLSRGSQMTTYGNSLLGALQIARMEAGRGFPVAVCGSANLTACDGKWGEGWVVFRDNATGNATQPPTGSILQVGEGRAVLSEVDIVGGNLVRFTSRAIRGAGSSTSITIGRADCGTEGRREITIEPGGKTAIERLGCAP